MNRFSPLTRRALLGALTTGGATTLGLYHSSPPALAVQSGISTSNNSLQATTNDGQITDIIIDQSALDFTLQYRNIPKGEPITVSIQTRLSDPIKNTGKYAFEEIATGSYTLPDNIGTASESEFTWNGLSNGLISTHSSITADDFASPTPGNTTQTEIDLELTFSWKNIESKTTIPYYIDITNKTTTIVGPTNGLVSYYPLNGSGVDIINGKNGIVDTPQETNDSVSGSAYDFTSAGDEIDLGTQQILGATTELTWSLWIKPNPTQNHSSGPGFFTFTRSDYDSWLQYQSSTDTIRYGLRNTSNNRSYFDSATSIQRDTWNHIVATWNGSTIALYINGSKDPNTASFTGTLNHSNARKSIGLSGDNGPQFDGKIDEVRIYNRALSDSEVQQLYTAEKP